MTTEIPAPVPAQVAAAESDAQDALRRADTKAATLLSLVGATLAGGIALSTRDMPVVSAVLLWLSLAPVFVSVVLLLLTLLPRLNQDPPAGTWLFAAQVGPSTLLETCTRMEPVAAAAHACTVARIARARPADNPPEESSEMSEHGTCHCGYALNANGNCFNNACWNANSKRHDGPKVRHG